MSCFALHYLIDACFGVKAFFTSSKFDCCDTRHNRSLRNFQGIKRRDSQISESPAGKVLVLFFSQFTASRSWFGKIITLLMTFKTHAKETAYANGIDLLHQMVHNWRLSCNQSHEIIWWNRLTLSPIE